MKKIIAALTVLALVSCNKKEETNIQTEETQTVETTEKQEPKSSTLLKEMSQEQISEVFAPKKMTLSMLPTFSLLGADLVWMKCLIFKRK